MIHPGRLRLLIVGVDAATFDLVGPWVSRGDLPALGSLMRDGAWGRLESVPNMFTPAAWTSFATGCGPAKHGIFFFTERIPGSYRERFISGAASALPPFWTLFGDGLSSAVVNVPMTYPARPLNGVLVAGMDAPGPEAPGIAYPPELGAALRERYADLLGSTATHGAIGHLVLAGRLDEALRVLEQQVEGRTSLGRDLIDRSGADVAVLVFTAVDAVQHYFWRYADPRLSHTVGPSAQQYRDAILRLYQAVDRSIGALLSEFDPAGVMVLSDHGAGASPGPDDGVAWLRLVLETMGLTARISRDPVRAAARGSVGRLYQWLNPRLPSSARQLARRVAPRSVQLVKSALREEYDWARTRAFCAGASGEVWLNVRGREAEGIVDPGAEYERLRQEIREAFLSLRDGATGEPIIEQVLLREEAYEGPFIDRAADLTVRFRDVIVKSVVLDGKVLTLPPRRPAVPKDVKSGSHRPDGLLIMAGEGVRRGAGVEGSRLIDIAPTTLYWLGEPVPAYMDGRVLTSAFTSEHLSAHPPARKDIDLSSSPSDPAGYTEEEAAEIMERLRGLGYV